METDSMDEEPRTWTAAEAALREERDRLLAVVRQREATIDRLHGIVENLARTVANAPWGNR